MPAIELEANTATVRPKTLSAAWLVQRALLGLFILVAGTVGSVWLYDASLKANALDAVSEQVITSAR